MAAEIESSNSNYDRIQEIKKFDESKIGTKGLSESGITSIPSFFIHSPEFLADVTLNPDHAPKNTIPTIDLSNISSPAHRAEIVGQVREAARTWGFFHVINHGVPQSTLDSTILAVKNFHDQPVEAKSKYYNREHSTCVKYSSNEDLLRSEAATWHDSLQVFTSSHVGKLDPADVPEVCRREVLEWDTCAKMVGESIMELLSEGLGLEKDRFKTMAFGDGRMMVAHCYSYCPQPDLTLGIAAHTDTSFLTVLLQDEIGGLQVKNGENGNWVAVKPVKGGLTINIGDTLQIVSNGEYNSVQHRVLANSRKESRISIAVFLNSSKWQETGYSIGPLPELLSPEKRALYRNFTLHDALENFYTKGLDSKSLVERVRIAN